MRGARACVAVATAALVVTATAAFAQTVPSPDRRWQVEAVGGLSLFELPAGGTAALPPAGPGLPTSGPTNQSRRVPTWFLGDGASLLNGVNAEFGVASRLTPLDAALGALGLTGANAPAVGIRVRRGLGEKWSAELSLEVLTGSVSVSEDLLDAVEATRASFETAFTGLLSTGPFSGVTVSASTGRTGRSSRELSTTAAVRYHLLSGRFSPYLTVGGGLVHQLGDLPTVTLQGTYRFLILNEVPIAESDTLTLRYEQATGIVGLVGGGIRHTLSDRVGLTLDGRVFLGKETLSLRLDSAPSVTTGTPAGFIESFTTPAIQFSNHTATGRDSSLSGTPLAGFKAFTTSGLQTRSLITAGVFVRF